MTQITLQIMTINIIIIIIFIMFLGNRHRLMKRGTHILVLSTHNVQ